MKYYLIAGEASGDLHASHLMQALKQRDTEAEFRFFGGDMMTAVGGTRVRHYRELAYMGFIPVLLHLPTILRNMKMCKQDIAQWHPDAVILVDYPGFNLKIAKFVKRWKVNGGGWKENTPTRGITPSTRHTSPSTTAPSSLHLPPSTQIFYYISPKIWAWKEYRIKNIKRDVDELFSILPFEIEFFEQKHHYPIHYVGNPTAQEVREWLRVNGGRWRVEGRGWKENTPTADTSPSALHPSPSTKMPSTLHPSPSTIALLAGSRKQEIKDNLPAMIEATKHLAGQYDIVLAGAPGIDPDYYQQFLAGSSVRLVVNETYPLLAKATAALVTSGTATLETCMFRVPQVVCYETPLPRLIGFLKRHVLKVKWISLVNLIANREVVRELVAETFSVENIRHELEAILPGGDKRERMLSEYEEVHRLLGDSNAPDEAARIMIDKLSTNNKL